MPPLAGITLSFLFIALAVASRSVRVMKGLGFTFVVLATGAGALNAVSVRGMDAFGREGQAGVVAVP
jgi:hypothetical protein